MKTFAKLKAVKTLETNIKSTKELMVSIHSNIVGMNYFVDKSEERAEKPSEMEKIIKKSMVEMSEVYKMGFVAMYANWEYFMFDVLKEIISNNPKCLDSEKVVKIDEIENISSMKELYSYIADKFAVQYSYTIDDFCKFLSESIKLEILSSDEKDFLEMMGLVRNAFLHSGSKVNSLFSMKMGKMLKTKVPINDDIDFNTERLFGNLELGLLNFIKRIK
jgi:hypothetical protein